LTLHCVLLVIIVAWGWLVLGQVTISKSYRVKHKLPIFIFY